MGKGREVAAREAVKERLEPGLGACAAGGAAGWAAGALWAMEGAANRRSDGAAP